MRRAVIAWFLLNEGAPEEESIIMKKRMKTEEDFVTNFF